MSLGCKVHKDLQDTYNDETSNHTTVSSGNKTSSSVDTSAAHNKISESSTEEHLEEDKTTVTERFDSLGRLTERTTENSHTTQGKKKNDKVEQKDTTSTITVSSEDSTSLAIVDEDHQSNHVTEKHTDIKTSFPFFCYILIAISVLFIFIWFKSGAHDVVCEWFKNLFRKLKNR